MDDATALPTLTPAHANIRGLRCNTLLGEAGWPRILSFIEQNERTIVSSLTCAGLLSAANSVRRTAAFGRDQLVIGGALSLERLMRARVRFPALCVHTLSLNDCCAVIDVFVGALAECCPLLESVDLSGDEDVYPHSKITDASVGALARSCPLLESVNLCWCMVITNVRLYGRGLITDASVTALAESCPLLESVNLCRCRMITDASVGALAESCPWLKSVDLSGKDWRNPSKITDVSIVALAGNCPLLESVDLACCTLLTDLSIGALAGNCPQLESVNVFGCELITDASIVALKAALPDVSVNGP